MNNFVVRWIFPRESNSRSGLISSANEKSFAAINRAKRQKKSAFMENFPQYLRTVIAVRS